MNLNNYYKKLDKYYQKINSYYDKLNSSKDYSEIGYERHLNEKMMHFHILWLIIMILSLTICFLHNIHGFILGGVVGIILTQTYFIIKCVEKNKNINKKVLAKKLVM